MKSNKKYVVAIDEFRRDNDECSGRAYEQYYDTEEEARADYNAIDIEHEFTRMCDADRRNYYVEKNIGVYDVDDEDEVEGVCDFIDSTKAGISRTVTYTVDGGEPHTCTIEYGEDITDHLGFQEALDLEEVGYCKYEYEEDDGIHTVTVDDEPAYWG